ncbi:protein-glutamate methylesterase/protein-glutamine glutaminase [Tropicimonas isoalkanivorans]|uniref:Protein-glutamate methylesterase/protein-glutamine glutaminase n=1 Tax=Tropicimonas isoalkanivorans TaxID=441112 RepID=A0A1I1D8V7_9RHOB|nr:chemotaxis response regulator protein-glutamate methylesterase [Tropicimonas isoalkanivorans]SFB70766.1 two-component system, chemotaxis family, response regulator CheB [Tropicimonas isoalkanivorans]
MKKRVVIVDDSRSMRGLIHQCLLADGRFDIVGEASEPFEARAVIRETNPDVITLDVEMPRMDGLTFLEKLMRLRPIPVVMLSTETHRGSAAAIEALSLGAVDCIGKPRAGEPGALADLAERVFVAACAHLPSREPRAAPSSAAFRWNGKTVLIGASTGGVDALERILCEMPANAPPILIAQHMPKGFLESFAERLSRRIAPKVGLARGREELQPGRVLIAPGGAHHLVLTTERVGAKSTCRLDPGEKCNGHRPSVDVLFRSAVPMASRVVPVLLTGMGRDGADGMMRLRREGAETIAQDRASCVVYGMPRVAVELGAVSQSVPLGRIASAILEQTSAKERAAT